MNIVTLGAAVRVLCQTRTFYLVLNAVSGFETFGACNGGCLMVARALQQAGVPGTLYSLWGKHHPPAHNPFLVTRPIWQHAMIKVDPNSYLDGDGLKTELQMYQRWSALFEVTALRPTTTHWRRILMTKSAYDVPYDERVVANLAMYFRVALDKRGILE